MLSSFSDILERFEYYPTTAQRVGERAFQELTFKLQPPDPTWPLHFQNLKSLFGKALGPADLCISRVGSTAVPDPAVKAIIDIDLAVPDPIAEDVYVPPLESVGVMLVTHELTWHEHRFFNMDNPYH